MVGRNEANPMFVGYFNRVIAGDTILFKNTNSEILVLQQCVSDIASHVQIEPIDL
jgi:hypothetical protein